ncbi:MAG: polysaccharide deacetylase family protein [Planctomycetaceae bacterium]|nr:polysaccharide deacetylase family protein [Planctomycetaceae bacterium]
MTDDIAQQTDPVPQRVTRREWLHRTAGTTAAIAAGSGSLSVAETAAQPGSVRPAQIAITFDLEMSRNFPQWEMTHWDYEKGNLNEETKQYAVEAARRVKAAGGVIHFFVVGRVFEQDDVGWLQQLAQDGHPVGNHTYDHVNVTATTPEQIQFRFQRAPWLLRGRTVDEVIAENIRLTTEAMRTRLGIEPAGFRTPGGFSDGLRDFPHVRNMLLEQGFSWVSSLYPRHPNSPAQQQPAVNVIQGIVDAVADAQPFAYSDGLIEVPMSPISDIGAFRSGRWQTDWFSDVLARCLDWTIENSAVYDFLGHPSCLYVTDPEFQAIETICTAVRKAEDRAVLTDLSRIAAASVR